MFNDEDDLLLAVIADFERWKRVQRARGVSSQQAEVPVIALAYITEDSSMFYGTEDGSTIYIPE